MASNIVQTSMGLFHEADICRLLWDPTLDKLSPAELSIKNSHVFSMGPFTLLSNSITFQFCQPQKTYGSILSEGDGLHQSHKSHLCLFSSLIITNPSDTMNKWVFDLRFP